MSAFIPGLRLSEWFYQEAVAPILARHFPTLRYAAALIGPGSEVLGFDTAQSTDHNWGPRLLLFLPDADHPAQAAAITDTLRHTLPHTFHGYPTSFGAPNAEGTRLLERTTGGPVHHKVEVMTVAHFVRQSLGIESYPDVRLTDWLLCPEQQLLELTAGKVFYDRVGELEAARATFRYYPRDLWLYRLAAQWARIGQQEAFVGRCGAVGDELGSRLVAAALVRDLMRLSFLMERTYAPYSKWFGTAFARLPCAAALLPPLLAATVAQGWPDRERHLSAAYTVVATLHHRLGITAPLPTEVSSYHDRPYQVIHAERFSTAIHAAISDPQVRQLPAGVGAIDQFVDSADVLTHAERRARLEALYTREG